MSLESKLIAKVSFIPSTCDILNPANRSGLPKAIGAFAKIAFMSPCTKERNLRRKFHVDHFQTNHPECVRQHF